MHRRFYWNSLDQLLDGPLPGVHLVFKQHPSERDDGGYRELVEGIARRAGVAATSIVRDIDLYTLLRAADAHLGLFSTVLTDAVAAGTANLETRRRRRAATCWVTWRLTWRSPCRRTATCVRRCGRARHPPQWPVTLSWSATCARVMPPDASATRSWQPRPSRSATRAGSSTSPMQASDT